MLQISSFGCSGSHVLKASVERCGIRVMHRVPHWNHWYPQDVVCNHVIFLYADPVQVALSVESKDVAWAKQHYINMAGEYEHYKDQTVDSLHLERMFDAYMSDPHPFDMLAVKYEDMWDNLYEIGLFLSVSDLTLPRKYQRFRDETPELCDTYRGLRNKIASYPSIWFKEAN